jgi:hypothetical protein
LARISNAKLQSLKAAERFLSVFAPRRVGIKAFGFSLPELGFEVWVLGFEVWAVV